MGRKHQYINNITSKDSNMLKAIARTGYLSHGMLRENLGIAERRIINFCRDAYIEKATFCNPKINNTEDVYRLTSKGQDFVRRELNMEYIYRSSSPGHDLSLSAKYLSLEQAEQDTWQTEGQLRDQFLEMLEDMRDEERYQDLVDKYDAHQISAIDASYVSSSGLSIGIEVTTDSYGRAEIQAKEEFSHVLNISTEYVPA